MSDRARFSIGGQIAFVVAACGIVGMLLTLWVGRALIDRVALRGEHGALWLAAKDAQRLAESSGHFLVTADLVVASNESHLAAGCAEQARGLVAIVDELLASPMMSGRREALQRVRTLVQAIAARADVVASGTGEARPEELASHDRDAAALLAGVHALRDERRREGDGASAQLRNVDAEVERMILIALGVYTLVMCGVGWLAWRSIARPLLRVRDAAERGAIAEDPTVIHGPLEVRQLWRAVARFDAEQREHHAALQQANLVKDRFVANMSHELRTPLNGVIGYLDLLTMEEENPARREMLLAAGASAQHLMGVIGDILDYSKFQSNDVELDRAVMDLQVLAREVYDMLRWAAADRGNSLELVLDERLPARVFGDPLRLRQVLINLAGNAIKFTENGRVSLELQRCDDGDGGVAVRFTVSDTGIGIAPAALDKLFRPFVQADASTTRQHGGTGLGLAISRMLIERMGGSVAIRSEVGDGTSISFEVAFEVADDEQAPVSLRRPGRTGGTDVSPGIVARTPGSRRVLLVEDNRINQRVTCAMLERSGFEVDVADNGLVAVGCFAANGYDVVLMDTQMPEMDGMEATRRIRSMEQDEGRARTRIVALTANTGIEDRTRCLAAGADMFLSKPVRLNELLAAIGGASADQSP